MDKNKSEGLLKKVLKADIPKMTFQLVSILVLLGVSTCLAFMKLPVEMGLSIVAGALGLTFANLDKFSEFKGGGFSAKLKEQVEAIVAKETEEQEESTNSRLPTGELKVIQALLNPEYTWRTVQGLINETDINIKEIGKPINNLVDLGLVQHSFGKGGSIYALTSGGRSFAKLHELKHA